MPYYKYYCEKCQKEFELEQKISEYKSIQNCPICKTESKRSAKDFCSNFDVKCTGFFGRSK